MGTDAWRNWQAFASGSAEREDFDDELQSDTSFQGGDATFGPYRLSAVIRDSGLVGPAVIVHGSIHADLIPMVVVDGKLAKADSSAYHGGTMSDEIAALISLALGVRVRFAGTLRLSGIRYGDAPRMPMYLEVPRLARPGPPNRELLPRTISRSADLDALSRLESFRKIGETLQAELVRAARSYATALWWANEDPNQAWLHLVTAVETAAKSQQVVTAKPVDLLQEHWPSLWETLGATDEAVKVGVADLVAPQMKATRTFIDFIDKFAPPPPTPRPKFDELDGV